MYLGTVIAMPLAGILAEYINWESIFYVFGRQLKLQVFIFPQFFCDDHHHFHHQDSWLSSGVAFGGGS